MSFGVILEEAEPENKYVVSTGESINSAVLVKLDSRKEYHVGETIETPDVIPTDSIEQCSDCGEEKMYDQKADEMYCPTHG